MLRVLKQRDPLYGVPLLSKKTLLNFIVLAVLLFIVPPSAEILKNRLINRGTEDADTVNKRMNRAVEEAEYMSQYDYIVVNDNLSDCVENVHNIIVSEQNKVKYNEDFIEAMTKELVALQKGEL